MTETERKVVDTLVGCGVVEDQWAEPIHAVDHAMSGWYTQKTLKFVEDLIARGLVHWEAIAGDGPKFAAKACWKEGKLP